MRQYWLKPFGTSTPPRPMPDRWTERFGLDPFELMSGPARSETPPQMECGDHVLFHAVLHVRLFAAAEIIAEPQFRPDSRWAPRWPWIYFCRVDAWVPRISDGPHSSAVVPQRRMGRIQRGSQYAQLTRGEYQACLEELLACPTIQRRR